MVFKLKSYLFLTALLMVFGMIESNSKQDQKEMFSVLVSSRDNEVEYFRLPHFSTISVHPFLEIHFQVTDDYYSRSYREHGRLEGQIATFSCNQGGIPVNALVTVDGKENLEVNAFSCDDQSFQKCILTVFADKSSNKQRKVNKKPLAEEKVKELKRELIYKELRRAQGYLEVAAEWRRSGEVSYWEKKIEELEKILSEF